MKALPVTLGVGLMLSLLLWLGAAELDLTRPAPEQPQKHMKIEWGASSNEESLLEGALIDTTPLYLPTYWNFSTPSPDPVHQRQLPPAGGPLPNEFLIQSAETWEKIEPTPEQNAEQTAQNLLRSHRIFPYSSFWKITNHPYYSTPTVVDTKLSLPLEIRSFKDGQVVWNEDLTMESTNPSFVGHIARPVEFRVLITPEGSLGPILMESFTGDPSIDEFLRTTIQEHTYWQRALPGYYQVWIGLL